MKRYDLRNPEHFREMERLAADGNAPLDKLPPEAFQYFCLLEQAFQAYRNGELCKEELIHKRRALQQQYQSYCKRRSDYELVYRTYQSNIRKIQQELIQVERATCPKEIARYACSCVEKLINESGFTARQMKKMEEDHEYIENSNGNYEENAKRQKNAIPKSR